MNLLSKSPSTFFFHFFLETTAIRVLLALRGFNAFALLFRLRAVFWGILGLKRRVNMGDIPINDRPIKTWIRKTSNQDCKLYSKMVFDA